MLNQCNQQRHQQVLQLAQRGAGLADAAGAGPGAWELCFLPVPPPGPAALPDSPSSARVQPLHILATHLIYLPNRLAGKCYLYMKTVERAHTPKNLWQKIKLKKNYAAALEQLDTHLAHWPKFLVGGGVETGLRCRHQRRPIGVASTQEWHACHLQSFFQGLAAPTLAFTVVPTSTGASFLTMTYPLIPQVHKNKQRLTKVTQYLIRMRKLALKGAPELVTMPARWVGAWEVGMT